MGEFLYGLVRRRLIRLLKEAVAGVVSPGGGMSIGSMDEGTSPGGEDRQVTPPADEDIKQILETIRDTLRESPFVDLPKGVDVDELLDEVEGYLEKVGRGERLTDADRRRIHEIFNYVQGRILETDRKRKERMYEGGGNPLEVDRFGSGMFGGVPTGGGSVSSLPFGGGVMGDGFIGFSPTVVGVFRKQLIKVLKEIREGW